MSGRTPLSLTLGMMTYGVLAGILATTAGAWASSPMSGGARIGVWIGVTAVVSLAFAWFAEAVVTILGRFLLHGLSGRPFHGFSGRSIFR
jgi:hypothetical protein